MEITEIIDSKKFYDELEIDNLANGKKYTVSEKIKLSQKALNWEHRIIKHIIFEETVLFEKVDLKSGLSFEFCEFRNGVVFIDVEVTEYNHTKFPVNSSLYFHSCKMLSLRVQNSTFLRGLTITKDSEIGKLNIIRCNVGNGGINITGSKILDTLDVISVETESFQISESIIESVIRFQSVNSPSISFIKTIFKNWINIWNVSCKSSLTFNYNEFNETVKISSSIINGLFSHGDTFKREVDIQLENEEKIVPRLLELYFTEIHLGERFVLKGGNKTLNKITFQFTSRFHGVVKFEDCNVLETNLTGVNENSKLIFKSIVFGNLNIHDFTNFNDISFSNCEGNNEGEIIIVDSDLGISKFNNFSFKSFSKIIIENAFLNNILCSNIDWFEDNQLDSNITDELKYYRNKRDVYRQLKQALSGNGNVLDSLGFQSKELKTYSAELKQSGNYNWGDRLIMLVSKTNNYGLSWRRATWQIVLITVVFYLVISILISDVFTFKPSCNLTDIKDTFYYWWSNNNILAQLFNPTRGISVVYGSKALINGVYWLDTLQRVILGIYIFQIIKAFRKFISK